MTRLSLVQRAVLTGWRGLLHDFRFLLHHHSFAATMVILLCIWVHARGRLGIRIPNQGTRLSIVYSLIGRGMLLHDHRLVIMESQILLITSISYVSLWGKWLVIKCPGVWRVLEHNWPLLKLNISKIHHYMSLRDVLLLWGLILRVFTHGIVQELFETLGVSEYVLLFFESCLLYFLWELVVVRILNCTFRS